VSDLVSSTILTSPKTVVTLSINFNIQPSVTYDDREIKEVLFNWVLRNRAYTRLIQRLIKDDLPVRHLGTINHGGVLRARRLIYLQLDIDFFFIELIHVVSKLREVFHVARFGCV